MKLPTVREIQSIETNVEGIVVRSRTEARWAVFFNTLGISFQYEPERIKLTNGESYLPDFYLPDFKAYLEVKADNDDIVTAEAARARQLAADRPGQRVWLTVGPPSKGTPNILTLDEWQADVPIEDILADPQNRYYFLQDRRDEGIYWLQANAVSGHFRHTFLVGGPGEVTDHERPPMLLPHIEAAYDAATGARW